MKSGMNEAQIVQGLSYKVCSTASLKFCAFAFQVFEIPAIIHQQLVGMLREHLRFVYRSSSMFIFQK